MKVVRLDITLPTASTTVLKNIAAEESISMAEGLRRAVALMQFFETEVAAGRKIRTLDEHGNNARDVIFLM